MTPYNNTGHQHNHFWSGSEAGIGSGSGIRGKIFQKSDPENKKGTKICLKKRTKKFERMAMNEQQIN
jgi:ligand-binding sensor domain-containing protein